MTITPIRNLVLMMDAASKRQEAIEAAERRGDLGSHQSSAASRVWSRQHEALSGAILAEPPQTFDDVIAVLSELASYHDLVVDEPDGLSKRELRDLHETTNVAVKNCALRLAALFRPDCEPTDHQHDAMIWVSKQVEQWLPVQHAQTPSRGVEA